MNFQELKLSKEFLNAQKSFIYTDKDSVQHQIHVKQTLPIRDKFDLFEITFQKAEINGQYNELLLDTYFHLHLVYMYTNLSFTEKQREDEFVNKYNKKYLIMTSLVFMIFKSGEN